MELPNFLTINTATSSQLRPCIEKQFDGAITQAYLHPGYHGPIYRVDTKEFVMLEGQEPLKINLPSVLYARTDALLNFMAGNVDAVKDKDGLTSFLKKYKEEIELDSGFKFLEKIANHFHSPYANDVKQLYEEISPGRWVMFQTPVNFKQAHEWCNIPHKKDQELRLFRFYLNVPDNSSADAVIFYGMASGGIAIQGRLNNHAVMCITHIEEIKNSGWPYRPIQS